MEKIATTMGSENNHAIETLRDVYSVPSQEDLECQVVEPSMTSHPVLPLELNVTGVVRSVMNYTTFFNLGLELDDRTVLHTYCFRNGHGAIGFVIVTFQINKHSFTQQFTVCYWKTRNLPQGQDFSNFNCTEYVWTHDGTKRCIVNEMVIMEILEPDTDMFFSNKNSIYIHPNHFAVTQIQCASTT